MIKFIKNNNILYIFLFLFSFSSQSQDFDQQFLDSLSPDIRDDLLEQVNEKKELENKNYRKDSSSIEIENERMLDIFGADFFSRSQTSFMPINEPNYDSNYILDFGDVIEVQLVGENTDLVEYEVRRDGSVGIKGIGNVFIAGMTLQDAGSLIQSKVNNSMIGVESYISLISVRDIQVMIAGNVMNPGPYTLNGNSNIFHAIAISGGPSDFGSYRTIDLVRDNQIIETIDLYDTLIFGKSSFGPRLRSGDLIFVRPINNVVYISGGVKREHNYEMKDNESLFEIINFSNGLNRIADLSDITLFRGVGEKITKIKIQNLEDLKSFQAKDGDRVIINQYKHRTAKILGAVKKPGKYILTEGQDIYDLVTMSGGFTKNAYPFGGILLNKATKDIEDQAADSLYKTMLKNFLTLSQKSVDSSSSDLSALSALTQEILDFQSNGRLIVEFDLDKLSEDKSLKYLIQEGDEIIIPEIINQVYVFGEVTNQGSTIFRDNQDFKYFINQKGGFLENADKSQIYILHPNGETVLVGKKNIFAQNAKKYEIHPGSIIFVPRKLNERFIFTQNAQAYAAILGNLGVSLASISVLKD